MKLAEAKLQFIASWGRFGTNWGINRTMAEIHALLYITAQPNCTDDVMERLNISRGNASMSLRALCDWGIIHRLHKRGERLAIAVMTDGDPSMEYGIETIEGVAKRLLGAHASRRGSV